MTQKVGGGRQRGDPPFLTSLVPQPVLPTFRQVVEEEKKKKKDSDDLGIPPEFGSS